LIYRRTAPACFQESMRAVLSISKIINQKQADAPKQMHLPRREYVQTTISIHILKLK